MWRIGQIADRLLPYSGKQRPGRRIRREAACFEFLLQGGRLLLLPRIPAVQRTQPRVHRRQRYVFTTARGPGIILGLRSHPREIGRARHAGKAPGHLAAEQQPQ